MNRLYIGEENAVQGVVTAPQATTQQSKRRSVESTGKHNLVAYSINKASDEASRNAKEVIRGIHRILAAIGELRGEVCDQIKAAR